MLLLLCCLLSLGTTAQSYSVRLHSVDGSDDVLKGAIPLRPFYDNSTDAYAFVQHLVPELQEKGYLAASLDSLSVHENVYDAYLYLGHQYRWARIDFSTLPPGLLVTAGIDTRPWEGTAVKPSQLAALSGRLLDWAENNGYPFAQAGLMEVHTDSAGGISGLLYLDKGPLRKIDSIEIEGDVRISRNFLMRYLDIRQGEPYSEKKLRNISPRLRELPYLQESKPWDVAFKISRTHLNLHLAERKANQLNAVVGLLPNNGETGRLMLTVDAMFAFQNIIGNGESISLSYQNLQYKSPRLKVETVYPYLFNTPIGAEFRFDYFKKDTSWRRTALQAGGRYQFNAQDYLRVFYQNQGNRLITADTAYVRRYKKLPETVDVSASGAGAELVLNRTDYRLNPRRGWSLRSGITALRRKVKPNSSISSIKDGSGFDYNTLYDTLVRNEYQVQVTGELAWYFPLGKRMTLKMAYNGGWISGDHLFRNELYQIGGFRLLRGFDEQSIYARQYHVLTLEWRALLSRNSYFYLFSDNGLAETGSGDEFRNGWYNGFGLGTSLETRSGLFSISYALGRDDNNPLQFRRSKVHFGYVAFF